MTLSRVVTATWLRMLFWKGVIEMATVEFKHYEDCWLRGTECEQLVREGREPKLLTD